MILLNLRSSSTCTEQFIVDTYITKYYDMKCYTKQNKYYMKQLYKNY